MKYSFIHARYIVAIFLLVSSCGKRQPAAEGEVVKYRATTVEAGNVSKELLLPGELEGYFETGILAKVNGYVKKIRVDIGDRVAQGQVLAELEAPELVSQVTAGFSEYRAKEAIFVNTKGRYLRLAQTNQTPGAVSPYDMDLARTNIVADSLAFVAARAKYESLLQLTAYLTITAPFEGIITARSVAPGAFVGPGDKSGMPLLTLRSESRLRLHVAVPEIHLAELGVGRPVKFSVKSFPGKTFNGNITRMGKSVSAQTRSEIIEIEIDNRDGQLLPGMYAQAIIPVSRMETSLVVPATAVVTNMERSFVIKVGKNGQRADWVDVEKGEMMADKLEVFGKLISGDTILVEGSDEIKNHQTLSIVMDTLRTKLK